MEGGDVDDVLLALVHFPEVLPAVTKQAVTKVHPDERKSTSTK